MLYADNEDQFYMGNDLKNNAHFELKKLVFKIYSVFNKTNKFIYNTLNLIFFKWLDLPEKRWRQYGRRGGSLEIGSRFLFVGVELTSNIFLTL